MKKFLLIVASLFALSLTVPAFAAGDETGGGAPCTTNCKTTSGASLNTVDPEGDGDETGGGKTTSGYLETLWLMWTTQL